MQRRLRVTLPDRSEVEHPLAKRTTIGAGANAALRLPAELGLEDEHLLLVPRDDGCWVAIARSASVPVTRDDQPFEDGLVPWGGHISVAGVTIEIGVRTAAKEGSRFRTLLLAVALGTAALVTVAVVRARSASAEGLSSDALEPSALWSAEPRACHGSSQSPSGAGSEALRSARARGERFHYDYQDGIEAVSLYQSAEACLLAAGAVPAAERASAEGRVLREDVERTYRRLRLSLSQSLERGDDAEALEATRALRELTSHRDDEYTAFLAELERELQLGLGLLIDESASTGRGRGR
ncbi:MAG: hypothetical protein M3Y87_24020 [Myxococcota bacterium]|nr:hypothetical protein [Myxococcota bacterium]